MINNKLLDNIKKLITKEFQDKYTILTQIGEGSFSYVFKCQDKEGQVWAIKIIALSELSARIIEYMENEIQILQKNLDNRNIIKLQDYKQTKEYIFLIMEYCMFDLEIIPEDLAIIILRQIAHGLCFLHQTKIIHRDLKLENIGVALKDMEINKITTNDFYKATFKLIDFGLSKMLGNFQHTMTFLGTPSNMAPEILEDKEYSFEVDMYSFGCCLFRMITGQFPYFEKNQSLLVKKIQSESAEAKLIKDPALRAIIQEMLRYKSQERITWEKLYQTKFFSATSQSQINKLDVELYNDSQFYRKLNQDSRTINNEKLNQNLNMNDGNNDQKSHIQRSENNTKFLLQDQILKLNLHISYSKVAQMIYQSLQTIQNEKNCGKAKYDSLFAQFQQYIVYLIKRSELIFDDLQQSNSQKQTEENQDIVDFGKFLDHYNKNYRLFRSWNDYLQQWKKDVIDFQSNIAYKLSETFGKLPKITLDNQNLKEIQIKNNKILFKQIKRVIQDIEYKYSINKSNEIQELRQLKYYLYQTLIYLVQIRAILEQKIKNEIDFKIFEMQIENCEQNPDTLLTILSDLFKEYEIQYKDFHKDDKKTKQQTLTMID